MTSLAIQDHHFKYHEPLVKKTKRLSKALNNPLFKFCYSGGLLIFVYVLSHRHMQEIRAQLNQCGASCQNLQDCIKVHIKVAKKVRSIFIKLDSATKDSLPYGLHKKALRTLVTDWDDFVVDLSISSDKKIHDIASKVAAFL